MSNRPRIHKGALHVGEVSLRLQKAYADLPLKYAIKVDSKIPWYRKLARKIKRIA